MKYLNLLMRFVVPSIVVLTFGCNSISSKTVQLIDEREQGVEGVNLYLSYIWLPDSANKSLDAGVDPLAFLQSKHIEQLLGTSDSVGILKVNNHFETKYKFKDKFCHEWVLKKDGEIYARYQTFTQIPLMIKVIKSDLNKKTSDCFDNMFGK